jgi:WD40 repeat protein
VPAIVDVDFLEINLANNPLCLFPIPVISLRWILTLSLGIVPRSLEKICEHGWLAMIKLVNGRGNFAPQQNFPVWQIPLGAALRIFSHMDLQSVCACSGVCRQWSLAFKDDVALKTLLHRCFPASQLEEDNLTRGICSLDITLKHAKDVTSIAIAGGNLFSGSEDCTIKIKDITHNARFISSLRGHQGVVYCLVVEGDRLFSASEDKTIKIWDLKTDTCAATLEGHLEDVNCLVIGDGRLFSCSEDKTIKVWENNTCIATLKGHTQSVRALVIANGKLFSGSLDQTIKVWKDNTCVATLEGHKETIWSLATGGGKLFSGSWDGEIKIWDLENYACIGALVGHTRCIRSLVMGGGRLFSGSADHRIMIWDLEKGTCTATLVGHRDWINSLAIDGGKLFSGSGDCAVMTWDFTASHSEIFEEIADRLGSRDQWVASLAFGQFNKMPEAAKNEIFKELDEILNVQGKQDGQDFWKNLGFTKNWYQASPFQRAQAIRSYLKKQTENF